MPEDPRMAPLEKAVHQGMRSSLVGIAANLVLLTALFQSARDTLSLMR
jgi:hypothetical protein